MRVEGLDTSTARCGWACHDGSLHSIKPRTGAGEPDRRLFEIRGMFGRLVRLHPPRAELLVLEGYSIGSPNSSTLLKLGEVGGVIRAELFELGIPYVVVPPASVKLFATGNGKADKQAMIDAATMLGAEPANDDEADAYHLRRMGRVARGLETSHVDHELRAIANCGVSW